MPTFEQLLNKKRVNRKEKWKIRILNACPFRRGTCEKVGKKDPKKPCSADRAVARVILSTRRRVFVHIQGVGHTLRKISIVLVRGGRPADLPGVRCRMVYGWHRPNDLLPKIERKSSLSLFGVRNYKFPYRRRFKSQFVNNIWSMLSFRERYNPNYKYVNGKLIDVTAPAHRTGKRSTLY